ncbi:interleukin-1 receptor-associated kinase 1-binding protein 1 [Anolis carolinensis]|uniref:Interleukin 1 receptor associated kinase 1 binding protein 1 n=1 Tax=Anolis carolinensis TaxID=28377 RepID=G1KD55_ANOCA|nr:PREDICTED: interleukin-1 receptor-associated kinase 1-binding protein 1 [Anolis carolinensis]|eukprot:XP_003215746.2 PREDICTED: interleukin-1 receptor-associated kinase 1-binding protein 1 [Anolis carolinensis]
MWVMPRPAVPPARIFAELAPPSVVGTENEPAKAEGALSLPGAREVHVSGSAELSARPDRAQVTLSLSRQKAEAAAARSSVSRRLDYIAQAARQRGEALENNLTVTKNFSRIDNAYKMEAEVCITFSDFGKMQDVCNFLVEKLDSSVIISPPHFYHTAEAANALRRQVCLAAVGSAQQKAQEVCQLFGQSLGKPLLIREEEVKEWEGHPENHTASFSDSPSLQQRLQSATIYASSRIFAVFEIKGDRKRKKAALLNLK